MAHAGGRPETDIARGTRAGLRLGLKKAFGEATVTPLPDTHVDLLMTMRRRERKQAERKIS